MDVSRNARFAKIRSAGSVVLVAGAMAIGSPSWLPTLLADDKPSPTSGGSPAKGSDHRKCSDAAPARMPLFGSGYHLPTFGSSCGAAPCEGDHLGVMSFAWEPTFESEEGAGSFLGAVKASWNTLLSWGSLIVPSSWQEPGVKDSCDRDHSLEVDVVIDASTIGTKPYVIPLEDGGYCLLQRVEGSNEIMATIVTAKSDIPADAVFRETPNQVVIAIDAPCKEPRKLDLTASLLSPPCCPLGALVEQTMSRWRSGAALPPLPEVIVAPFELMSPDDQRLNDLIDAQLAQYPAPRPLPEHYQVGYRPTLEPVAEEALVLRSLGGQADWAKIAESKISFHFQGSSLADIASFFHHATGMTVRVDPSAKECCSGGPGIHVLCRDKGVEQSLRVVLGSCGLGYMVQEGELVLASPEVIRQTALHHGKSIETDWVP